MSTSAWLDDYYGTAKKVLRPSIVTDGKYYAIVMLMVEDSMGFVLIRKNGKHGATPHEILHAGPAKDADFARMKARLTAIDK
jgi:hypothetical protein